MRIIVLFCGRTLGFWLFGFIPRELVRDMVHMEVMDLQSGCMRW